MTRRAVALACVTALAPAAGAQLRPAAHPRCALAAHAAVAPDEDPDPRWPAALLALGDRVVVAWRDRGGGLLVQRYDRELRPLGAPVELARPVGAFALARTPAGVALAYVERDHDLVVARRSASLDAQNVPRVVAAAVGVTAIAMAAAPGGSLLAWAGASGVRVLPLNPFGVPRAEPAEALSQVGSRSLRFDGADPITLRVDAVEPAVDPWLLALRADGAVLSRARWPVAALGPVRLGGTTYTAQINPLGSPMLLRSSAVIGPAALADPSVAPRAQLDALAVDHELALALVTDRVANRPALVRLFPDGSASWLTGVRGALAGPATFLALAPDGALLLTREGAHLPARTVLQRWECAPP